MNHAKSDAKFLYKGFLALRMEMKINPCYEKGISEVNVYCFWCIYSMLKLLLALIFWQQIFKCLAYRPVYETSHTGP